MCIRDRVLLMRLIREPGDVEWERAVIAGAAIALSNEDGKGLLDAVLDYRRQVEISAGSFELGDWPEFAKRYGHMLLWTFARMRFAALVDAVTSIHYVTEGGQPYLYALSLIHISEPTRLLSISYAVFCLKKKKNRTLNPR